MGGIIEEVAILVSGGKLVPIVALRVVQLPLYISIRRCLSASAPPHLPFPPLVN